MEPLVLGPLLLIRMAPRARIASLGFSVIDITILIQLDITIVIRQKTILINDSYACFCYYLITVLLIVFIYNDK